jgi:N-methylhydantoinase B
VQSVEVVESQCPLRIERYALREGSCGDGEHRGGLGMVRDIRVLGDGASLSVLADKNVIPPFGVAGGASGAGNRFTVIRGETVVEPSPVPGKVGGFALEAGDVVRVESSGGGGHGDPLRRDTARVADDVRLGYLDSGQARTRYGVCLDTAGTVDEPATGSERQRLLDARVKVTLEADNQERPGPRRWVALPRAVAARLRLAEGELVELSTPGCGASLRAWVKVAGDGHAATLGADGLAILGAQPGAQADVRAVLREPGR